MATKAGHAAADKRSGGSQQSIPIVSTLEKNVRCSPIQTSRE
jgi:hypothetical protein